MNFIKIFYIFLTNVNNKEEQLNENFNLFIKEIIYFLIYLKNRIRVFNNNFFIL